MWSPKTILLDFQYTSITVAGVLMEVGEDSSWGHVDSDICDSQWHFDKSPVGINTTSKEATEMFSPAAAYLI